MTVEGMRIKKQWKQNGFDNRKKKEKLRGRGMDRSSKSEIEQSIQQSQEADEENGHKIVRRKRKSAEEDEKKALAGNYISKKDPKMKKNVNDGVKKRKMRKLALFENDDDSGDGLEEGISGLKSDEIGMDDNSSVDDDDFSSSGSDSGEGELPIERKSRMLERKEAKDKEMADEELQLNIASEETYTLPSVDEVEDELKMAPNLRIIKQRIADVLQVLGDFKKRRDKNRSRSEYVSILTKDLCSYYGYSEYLMQKFMNIFPNGTELLEFLEANEQPRPVIIRSNSLKTRRAELARTLINRGMNVDPAAEWTKVGLIVYDSQVPVGATPEYLAGHYMLQGLSSMLPVMALAPQPEEIVLDMCAAPGGKSSHIAALMKNTGVVYANDADMQRCRAVIGNLHRLGVNNAVVSNLDGREFAKIMPQGFDRVLLDAPCSGTGVIWKDGTVKTRRDSQDVQRCHTLQRQLVLAALDAINANSKTGGYLVYSTCSVLVEENEAVVDYALRKRNCKLVPMGLNIGVQGFAKFREYRFHPSLVLTRRYYPHVHNIDGFFVAKIKKLSNEKQPNNNTSAEADTTGINLEHNDESDTSQKNAVLRMRKKKKFGMKKKPDMVVKPNDTGLKQKTLERRVNAGTGTAHTWKDSKGETERESASGISKKKMTAKFTANKLKLNKDRSLFRLEKGNKMNKKVKKRRAEL